MAQRTGTYGMVSDDLTQCSYSTSAHTGVLTLVDHTGQLWRTIRAKDTFRSAVGWGSKVSRGTVA